jgi:hypothetical protein
MTPASLEELEALLRREKDLHGVTIIAGVAKAILEHWNNGNRRIDQVAVQRYRRDQEAGRWLQDGEIGFGVFADSITLGDGQHRLQTQVITGLAQRYFIRVVGDPGDFGMYVMTRDAGKGRTIADMLGIFGIAPANASTFERIINAMQSFYGTKAQVFSRQERIDFARDHVASVRYVLGLPRRRFKAHLLAAIALAYGKAPGIQDTIAAVVAGTGLSAGTPAHVLSQSLAELNDAKDAKSKDRAMGMVLRVLHDGLLGRRRSAVTKVQADSTHVREGIGALVSKAAAEAWIERQTKKAGR